MKVHVGCSGFSYKEWKGGFYPAGLRQRDWFDYYASQFSTLELNASFYKFPQVSVLRNWYEKSPPHFVFTIKAPQLITHYKQMKECKGLLTDFYTICRDGLQDKLGPLLFQFPARFTYSPERMERILTGFDPAFLNVVEFRDRSWWNEQVGDALAAKGLIFCGQSFPGLPDQPVVTASTLYYRFHGVPDVYYSAYSVDELERIAGEILSKRAQLEQLFIYFNNTAALGAIDNARWMESFLADD